jgi:hypothetical protein
LRSRATALPHSAHLGQEVGGGDGLLHIGGLADEARADRGGRSRMSLNYILYLIGALVVLVIVLKLLGLF